MYFLLGVEFAWSGNMLELATEPVKNNDYEKDYTYLDGYVDGMKYVLELKEEN